MLSDGGRKAYEDFIKATLTIRFFTAEGMERRPMGFVLVCVCHQCTLSSRNDNYKAELPIDIAAGGERVC